MAHKIGMDPHWIERAKAGDRAALDHLLDEIASPVYRFSRRMCRSSADAEDITQDTLLAATQHLSQYAGHASFQSWVFAIARSACSHRHRGLRNKPHQTEDKLAQVATTTPDPEAETLSHEHAAIVHRGLDSLPSEQREVLWLRDVEGLSGQETAEALGVSLEAVKSRLHRARQALRQIVSANWQLAESSPLASCPDVVEMMSRKLEGDLVVSDCTQMEQHIATCTRCKGSCDELRKVLVLCRQAASERIPSEVRIKLQRLLSAL